ncbi:GNAT family N-acetyltransferase [Staphylococcus arlettae]|uniref:GNAT family N-acetyltransferase n=1 Tax=Staphylococcus arlettae TaxID=29378 RepID=UPI001072A13E|nr:GNAT family N-acetyltransferase [Staphylococcus arlettae]MBF0738006.1 GNAT family N-acetyltransferase [Staphylococcus arlettae]MCD9055934.1 GNAT family N-acetyltransferase [Staphylococcus arlettae]TFU46819.1 GNAT family N-acetyltransferase [Staphylococcus arlettae]UXU50456.1 GNAT family N-acetyltransferase [Staphylococcus arlettae]BBK27428.1 N-acetyltransferase [Staphylococcus arlettae]
MIDIKHEPPTVETYRRLRKDSGMSEKTIQAAEQGLGNACFDVVIYDDGYGFAMGRVIGDGGTAFQIIDVAVDPKYQGLGYGKMVLTHIMDYIEAIAVPSSYVSLIADYPADKLYKQFGFESTEPNSGGMYIKY